MISFDKQSFFFLPCTGASPALLSLFNSLELPQIATSNLFYLFVVQSTHVCCAFPPHLPADEARFCPIQRLRRIVKIKSCSKINPFQFNVLINIWPTWAFSSGRVITPSQFYSQNRPTSLGLGHLYRHPNLLKPKPPFCRQRLVATQEDPIE